jgi:co-chaperonin GroES (HSP10)
MKLIPLNNKVAVVRLKNKLETDSGIVLTRSTGEVDKAKVIAVGPEVTSVKLNDVLLIDWNKASVNTLDGVPIYMIPEEHIVAVYEEKSA